MKFLDLFVFNDVQECFDNLITFAIPAFILPVLDLLTLCSFPKNKTMHNITISWRNYVEIDRYIGWPIFLADTDTDIYVSVLIISVSARTISVSASVLIEISVSVFNRYRS